MPEPLLSLITVSHVVTGTIAVLAGAVALLVRKGFGIHIMSGRMFMVTMAASSIIGAALGLIKMEEFLITFFAGLLGTYLVLTAWLAARTRDKPLPRAAKWLGFINLVNVACLYGMGVYALGYSGGAFLGFAGESYLFLGTMALAGLITDVSLMFRTQLSDRHRIARHIWRVCLGFFIAAGSAFTGPGMAAFPEAVQRSGVLSLPELMIFLAMVFYLIKTLLGKTKPPQPAQ